MSSSLLLHSHPPEDDGTVLTVTPASADWTYVGFEVLSLRTGAVARRATAGRELCIVVISGRVDVASNHGEFAGVGGRADPWSGMPDAVYLPPGAEVELRAVEDCELGLCFAPAPQGGVPAQRLLGEDIEVETRGWGNQERTVHPILMGNRSAESLLVTEVFTPGGHWSSYPPHKHDQDNPPVEYLLEETYYHRIHPAQGFGLQRVYTEDRSLDETVSFGDRDCVLVPRGYHTVSAPPGYDVYYLNVMAGPTRNWTFANDADHDWTMTPEGSPR